MAKINIVGVGPGSADYVTPIARKTVQQAQVIFGAQRSINLFSSDIKGEVFVLTAKNLSDSLKHAAESVKSGKNVALLSTGDPGFSGLLHTVLESGLFTTQQVNVVAGVSSIQACAANLNISWDNACLFTFHEGNVTDESKKQLVQCLKKGRTALLLPDAKAFSIKEIASFLIKAGLQQKTSVYICENSTLENEKIISSTLEEVSAETFGSLCVMVIKANIK
ncbi:precorrin-6y C5,15-methyltransferase (decarboxylating) subunit CbiE [Candidatus Bathyarchaeota archaeon]|nr:MAG: precorrin-6y C5,15-methyltransferase (decarboxylating) subunit CbiE [Candidatus Bathyarchaeota archaeon]